MFTLGAFALLLLVGVPIGLSLCLGAVVYIADSGNPLLFNNYPLQLFGGVDSYGLIAIPLFILIGEIMNGGGITQRIVHMAMAFVGSMRAGLAYVNVLANMMVSSILGSATAQVAIRSQIMVPEMERKGYDKTFAAGLTAYGGMLGPIIPPSIPMVIYAILVEASVGHMFVGGIIPGVLMGLLLMGMVWIISMRRGYAKGTWGGMAAVATAFTAAIAALATPVIILGGILGGVFTVTEAGAIACVYCGLIAVFVYRQLTLKEFWRSLVTAAHGTASVMLIVGASGVMGWMIADLQINKEAATLLLSFTTNDWVFLTVVNVFFLIVGMFMDPLAALIVFVPILMPAVQALAIDPIHFGVVIVINLMIGLCTPPVGYLIYLMANVANEPPQAVIRESLPFLGVLIFVLLLVTYIPALTLTLPKYFLG
jgi:tripartite ATP-independent transporter DctM subunit